MRFSLNCSSLVDVPADAEIFLMTIDYFILWSIRCQVRDKEVDCREKDSEIQDLKEKLTTVTRQMEMQKAELIQQVESQVSDFECKDLYISKCVTFDCISLMRLIEVTMFS